VSEPASELHAKALTIHARLIAAYGRPEWEAGDDPVSQIVNTILSQSTTDVNRDRAYRRLRQRFPTWEAVRAAPVEEIIEAIRPAGLAPQRAPRIQAALNAIAAERGALTLDFLRQMPAREARAWLQRIKGVGPKTASIVLLFSLGMPAFPVDTHIHRVSRRLGLAPAGASAPKVQEILEALLPAEAYYPFHLNLIAHGRRVCKAQRPRCDDCFLSDLCDYFSQTRR
jgi:endonuclease-3